MFEAFGATRDDDQPRRSVLAGVGTSVVFGLLLGLVVATRPGEPEPKRYDEPDMVLLLEDEQIADPEAWDLPPPPPRSDDPEELDPWEGSGAMDTAIPGRDPDADSGELGDTAEPYDDEGTGLSATAVPDPEPESVDPEPQPRPEPTVTGPPRPEPTAERVYDLPLRRRLRTEYPEIARRQNLGDVTCRMAVWVDRDGEARRVQPLSCPSLFRTQARVSLMEARFETFEAPDTNTWRRVELDVVFRM